MPDTTSPLGFPFPEGTDAPNGAAQIEALAEAVEAHLLAVAPVRRFYSASTSWNKPADSTGFLGVMVELQAGGGGAGGNEATTGGQTAGAGGGQGGAYAKFWVPAASLASSVTVTVGAGGAGGASGNNSGSTGGASSFGGHGSVPGGAGGAGGGAASPSWSTQAGGSASQSFSGTATNVTFVRGSDGGTGMRFASTVSVMPGYGGASHLGGQRRVGPASSGNILSVVGILYGGGGSAPGIASGSNQAANFGEFGAAGCVIVTEYYA